MWKYIFSIGLLAWSICSFSQENNASQKKNKIDWKPYEVKFGVNAIRSGRAFFQKGVTTHELEMALALHTYNLVLDFGFEEHVRGEEFNYLNKGSYLRIGFDRNFIKDKASGNVLSLGLRYARASFEDEMSFTSDQGYGEQAYSFKNGDLSARWLELAMGLRGKVVADLYMGFTMRWQFSRKVEGEGTLKSYDIPGFGKTSRQNSTAFDYYLMWRLPFGE